MDSRNPRTGETVWECRTCGYLGAHVNPPADHHEPGRAFLCFDPLVDCARPDVLAAWRLGGVDALATLAVVLSARRPGGRARRP